MKVRCKICGQTFDLDAVVRVVLQQMPIQDPSAPTFTKIGFLVGHLLGHGISEQEIYKLFEKYFELR